MHALQCKSGPAKSLQKPITRLLCTICQADCKYPKCKANLAIDCRVSLLRFVYLSLSPINPN